MAPKKKNVVPLSDGLEKLVLSAAMRGLVPHTDIQAEELSKIGAVVHKAIAHLRSYDDAPDDLPTASIASAAAEILGADHREIGAYIRGAQSLCAGKEAGDLLKTVRQKVLLVQVLNEAGNQLATGAVDIGKISASLDEDPTDTKLISCADMLVNGFPEEPRGLALRSLPLLSEASGGLMGLWAVASEAGVGKSTLAVQLALEYCRVGPVLYYDMENGPDVMLYRIGQRFKGDLRIARRIGQNLYFKETIRTLTEDLRSLKGRKCLIVVDSLQKLPISGKDSRAVGLGAWVHRLERLKKKGHTILLISEKNREEYGSATQRGFKETGEVEYSADFGFHLLPEKGLPLSNLIVVKNRHRPVLGSICALERVNSFRFIERGT